MDIRKQHGFTLIELMITMLIASSIWLGVFNLMQTQMRASMLTQDGSELQSSAQAVMEMVRRDVLLAGMGIANANAPMVHVNNYSSEGDRLTLYTIAQLGSTINTAVVAGPLGTTNEFVDVRCFGEHGWGGASAVNKDAVLTNNSTVLSLAFYSPFNGERISSTPQLTEVLESNPTAGGACVPNSWGVDSNADGIADPVAKLKLANPIAVPNGTVVYGVRWDGVDPNMLSSDYVVSAGTLMKSGTPVLAGVENFQVRYHIKNTPPNQWLDVLTGVDATTIDNVRVSMVIRQARRHPNGVLDARTTITNYDQTYTIPDRSFPRETYEFFMRPVNNNYKGN